MRLVLLVAAYISVFVGCSAKSIAAEPIRHFDLEQIGKFGAQIYRQDHEAAVATDILFAEKIDLEREHIRGWIAQSRITGDHILFIREAESGALEAAYDISFETEQPELRQASNRTLSEQDLAQFAAQRLAIDNVELRCTPNINIVTLRSPEDDTWFVWVLSATTNADEMLFGGHYRFNISADGKTVIRRDALSFSCLALQTPKETKKKKLEAMVVTHLVSDTPVETHVFNSLLYRLPIYVKTTAGLWSVRGSTIELLPEKK